MCAACCSALQRVAVWLLEYLTVCTTDYLNSSMHMHRCVHARINARMNFWMNQMHVSKARMHLCACIYVSCTTHILYTKMQGGRWRGRGGGEKGGGKHKKLIKARHTQFRESKWIYWSYTDVTAHTRGKRIKLTKIGRMSTRFAFLLQLGHTFFSPALLDIRQMTFVK